MDRRFLEKYWSHSEEEVDEMIRVVKRCQGKVILEIGCFKFNMALTFLTSVVKEPDPLVISMDVADHSPKRRGMLKDFFGRKFEFILANSHSEEAKIELKKALTPKNKTEARKVDVLFLDGDHKIITLEQDMKDYLPFLNPEGFIIWHDALQNDTVYRYLFNLLGQRYPVSLHYIKESLIAYIEVKKFIQAEERMRRWKDIAYDGGKWAKWPPNTPNLLEFWSSFAA